MSEQVLIETGKDIFYEACGIHVYACNIHVYIYILYTCINIHTIHVIQRYIYIFTCIHTVHDSLTGPKSNRNYQEPTTG